MDSSPLALQKLEPCKKRNGSSRPISHLEGRVCHVKGRIKEIVRTEDGVLDMILIKNAQVRPNLRDVPLASIAPIKVDHFWVTPPDDPGDLELLMRVEFIGTCYKYRRSNGTHDYGIEAAIGGSIDALIEIVAEVLAEKLRNCERYSALDEVINILEKIPPELRWLYSETESVEEAEQCLERMRAKFKRYAEAEAQALQNAPRNGKPKGLAPIPSRCRKPRQRAVAGF